MHSTATLSRRRMLALAGAAPLAACAAPPPHPQGPASPTVQDGTFVMPDGARLPYRAWLPADPLQAVMLALHGMNDSRDAWEVPAPDFLRAGIGLYGPDQRGFGRTATRGTWPGGAALAADAAEMLRQIAALHPGVPLVALGESMGGAVLMRLAADAPPKEVSGWVLAAPAVWGRAEMDLFLRSGLWLVSHLIPAATVTGGGPIRVWASDNLAAIRRLSRDPLTLHTTSFAALHGLVDLMDDALAAAPRMPANTLALYGAHDELVPKHAMAATWRALPSGVCRAFYPNDYHLLLRDLGRAAPIGDIFAWSGSPGAALPSGADLAAAAWLNERA